MGEIPLLTENGNFIINGNTRVLDVYVKNKNLLKYIFKI